MENFLISFRVVFPLFLMMALGFCLKKVKLLGDVAVKQVNTVIFRVLLPVLVFKNIYESRIEEVFNLKLILFSVVCVLCWIVLLFLAVPLIVKKNEKRGVLIQAIFRSNFVLFGLPITEILCGSSVSGAASVLIAVIIPLFNFAAVITLEVFNSQKPNVRKIMKGIAQNPLILASLIGLAVSLCQIRFPLVIESTVSSVASITTPLALIILGASIHFQTVGSNLPYLIGGLVGKLLLVPGVCLPLAALVFGFRGAELAILLALFASPSAVSSFTMAQQMGGDDELAGQLVMFGTVACVLTMFFWIFLSVQLGWI